MGIRREKHEELVNMARSLASVQIPLLCFQEEKITKLKTLQNAINPSLTDIITNQPKTRKKKPIIMKGNHLGSKTLCQTNNHHYFQKSK